MAVSRQELEAALQELTKALEGFASQAGVTPDQLEAFRVQYVGRSGKVTVNFSNAGAKELCQGNC